MAAMCRSSFTALAVSILFCAGGLEGAEQRTVSQPASDSVLALSFPDEQLVVTAKVGGKETKWVVSMDDEVSWFCEGLIETRAIEDTKMKCRWALLDLELGTARISREVFQLKEAARAPLLPEGCAGVIGHATLREFCVTFDFAENRLILHSPGSAPQLKNQESFPLELKEKVLVIPGTEIQIHSGQARVAVFLAEKEYLPFVAATFFRKVVRSVPRALLEKKLPSLLPDDADNAHSVTIPKITLGPLTIKDAACILTGSKGPQDAGEMNIRGIGPHRFVCNYPALMGGIRHSGTENYDMSLPSIGLALAAEKGKYFVSNVEPGSTAEKAGLKAGDHVSKISGISIGLPWTPEMDQLAEATTAEVTWQRGTAAPVTATVPEWIRPVTDPLAEGYKRQVTIPDRPDGVPLPLESTLTGLYLALQINGKPVRALLDTGADATIITPKLAQALGIKGGAIEEALSGAGLTQKLLVGVATRIETGGIVIENEPLGIGQLPEPVEMLLGMATLRDFDVRIDPRKKRLTLWPAGKAPAMAGEYVLPLTVKTMNPAPDTEMDKAAPQRWRITSLTVSGKVQDTPVDLVLDTGFSGTLQLPLAVAEKCVPGIGGRAKASLPTGVTISGTTASREAVLPSFQFGQDTLHALAAGLSEAPKGTKLTKKGLLGNGILRHYVMTLNFPAGQLRLLPLGTVQEVVSASTAGLNLDLRDGVFVILSVDPAGPAKRAGLLAGDTLLEIAGVPLSRMTPTLFDQFKRLPPGTPVKITYQRGENKPATVEVILEKK